MLRPDRWLINKITHWLTKERRPSASPLCDFKRLRCELQAGDVLLVEGRSRVSDVIKIITQSSWTHSALYIGRINEITDETARNQVQQFYGGDPNEQLLLEAELGQGTIISPITKYRHDHLRICRATNLDPADALKVILYGIQHIGTDYDVRQILDLARFFFPWTILPRRWRSSLFEHNAGVPTQTVCSYVIVKAFDSVNFPILPFIDRREDGSLRFYKRNPKLYTPKDFDYSPYFNIIKYPYLDLDDIGVYRKLPWSSREIIYNDEKDDFLPDKIGVKPE